MSGLNLEEMQVDFDMFREVAEFGDGRRRAIEQINQGHPPNELVAICVWTSHWGHIWVRLRNERPGLEFEVSGDTLHDTVRMAKETFGPMSQVVMLWHSHYVSDEPSPRDIRAFPEWLCPIGVVYSAKHDTYRLYNHKGPLFSKWEHGD